MVYIMVLGLSGFERHWVAFWVGYTISWEIGREWYCTAIEKCCTKRFLKPGAILFGRHHGAQLFREYDIHSLIDFMSA